MLTPQPNPRVVNETEIDARIGMLQAQRDNAMNIVVLQAGEIAMLRAHISMLEKAQADSLPAEVPVA